jgi:Skp family chaperone for outer membrane proteins
MTKKSLAFAFSLSVLPLATAQAAPPPPPAPKIVVFDERALMQFSKAGQDIQRQVRAYADQVQKEKAATQKSLQAEEQQLQQQVAILAPDVRAKKVQAFQQKADSAQAALQRKAQQIDAAVQQAQGQMSKVLGPILQQAMKERGANLVVLKQAVLVASTTNFDITGEVINLLNAKLPAVKVSLSNPSASSKKPPKKK